MNTATLHPVTDYLAELFNFLGIAEGKSGWELTGVTYYKASMIESLFSKFFK